MLGRRFTSERIRRERRTRFLMWAGIGTALAIAIVLLFSQISFIEQISIARVEFEGNETVSNSELLTAVQPFFDGAYLHLFSKRNTFLVRTNMIEQHLLTNYPRFKRVRVDRRGFTKLRIITREREPYAWWCENDDTCYFMDAGGLVYLESLTFKRGTPFIRFSGGNVSVESPVGSAFLPLIDFGALTLFMEELGVLELNVQRVAVEDDRVALDVATGSETDVPGTFSLFVTASSSYATALGDLTTIFTSADFKQEVPSLSLLDYIDLRFGNKVFYKLKSGVTTEIEE